MNKSGSPFLIVTIILLASFFFFTGCSRISKLVDNWRNSSDKLITKQVVIQTNEGKVKLKVEVADEPDERSRGYMFREEISEKQGMWFIFGDEASRTFWMRNTKISLDILFVDKDFVIREIIENVPPCESDPCQTYASTQPATYVLEVKGGLTSEKGIQVGDQIEMK